MSLSSAVPKRLEHGTRMTQSVRTLPTFTQQEGPQTVELGETQSVQNVNAASLIAKPLVPNESPTESP